MQFAGKRKRLPAAPYHYQASLPQHLPHQRRFPRNHRQQYLCRSGRGNIGKTALERFTLLNPYELNAVQLASSANLLNARANIDMLPFNDIVTDTARADLDREFLHDILGLPEQLFEKDGPLELLRRKLGAEPSIHGNKKRTVSG